MTIVHPQRSVLVIGRSQRVLDDTVAALRELGYRAAATSDFFSDIPARYPPQQVDLVIFGGQVPPDRRIELSEAITAINPRVVFVRGLAGIPGLIVKQIDGAFAAGQRGSALTYESDARTIGLNLAEPDDVIATAWWTTSTVPPDPGSDSLVLLDDHLPAGEHTISIPDDIPRERAFATVQIAAAVYAFSVATAG